LMVGGASTLHGERANRHLDRAARAERVAIVALRAADTQPVGVFAEHLLDRQRLRRVVERSRRSVGVDIADLAGRHVGVGERKLHRARRLTASGRGAVMWYASLVKA